jgi:tRNA(adenine34) deaminase
MCAGAIVLSRIRNLYYGTDDPKAGAIENIIQIRTIKRLNHHPRIESGILREPCSEILTAFFREKRKKPKRKREDFRKNDE